jgi:hypothetical protein
LCCLLDIQQLVLWKQVKRPEDVEVEELQEGREKVKRRVYRITVGAIAYLKPVEEAAVRYTLLQNEYCDGTEGHIKRSMPTMLHPNAGWGPRRNVQYAMWLHQIECPLVRAEVTKDISNYLSPNKMSNQG